VQVERSAQRLAADLRKCLLVADGLNCELFTSMTSASGGTTAEYRVPVLMGGLDADAQAPSFVTKNNIERFVWEFLTNRTFAGEPHGLKDDAGDAVGCDPVKYTCSKGEVRIRSCLVTSRSWYSSLGGPRGASSGRSLGCRFVRCAEGRLCASNAARQASVAGVVQVCMHLTPGAKEQRGQCVRATSRYVPSYSTKLAYVPCGDNCIGTFALANDSAGDDFADKYGLPPDPMWTETYNDPVAVSIGLRDSSSLDNAVLVAGILVTAVAAFTVGFGRRMYHRHLKTL
jgi:hypothetical protein